MNRFAPKCASTFGNEPFGGSKRAILARVILAVLAIGAAWEALWWVVRVDRRDALYAEACQAATTLRRPLVVIGAPDLGPTRGPGAGDLVVDIAPSQCPRSVVADICDRIPLESDSCVVFVSCVLEYVDDYDAAMREILRVSGGHCYIARVEPWTLTAHLYPGARRTIPEGVPSTGGGLGLQVPVFNGGPMSATLRETYGVMVESSDPIAQLISAQPDLRSMPPARLASHLRISLEQARRGIGTLARETFGSPPRGTPADLSFDELTTIAGRFAPPVELVSGPGGALGTRPIAETHNPLAIVYRR